MKYKASTVDEYINALPKERQKVVAQLRQLAKNNLPDGFKEQINYNMLGYVVPFSIYPNGYHCDSEQPLPFLSIASQKNHVAVYHSGIYTDESLMKWFVNAYNQLEGMNKLDMGKSCIRFKNLNKIPYELLGELFSKMTVEEWIKKYESVIKK